MDAGLLLEQMSSLLGQGDINYLYRLTPGAWLAGGKESERKGTKRWTNFIKD